MPSLPYSWLRLLLLGSCAVVPLFVRAQDPVPLERLDRLDDPLVVTAGKPIALAPAAVTGQTGFTNFLNINSRETVHQFFNSVYGASDGVPMDWSGNYATGNAGTNSTEYLRSVL